MKMEQKDRKFFFGKYRGRFIKDIIKTDTQYITWTMKNVKFFWYNTEEVELYKKQIVGEARPKNQYELIMASLEKEKENEEK